DQHSSPDPRDEGGNERELETPPESWDWTAVDLGDGQPPINLDSPVRNQGNCGSCYVVAAISALEVRARVRSLGLLTPDLRFVPPLEVKMPSLPLLCCVCVQKRSSSPSPPPLPVL